MTQNKLDISRPTEAIKDARFVEALSLLESNLTKDPNHIDSLYLAAVSSRYLKKYDDAKKYIESCLLYTSDAADE